MRPKWLILGIALTFILVFSLWVYCYLRGEQFRRRISIPPFNPPLVQDTPCMMVTINETQVGAALLTKWNAGFHQAGRGGGFREQVPMTVLLRAGGAVLANGTSVVAIVPASVVTERESDRVVRIWISGQPDIYPKNASIVGDRVETHEEELYPLLKLLRVLSYCPWSPYENLTFHTSYVFNETAEGWSYAFTKPGEYVISYRFARETLFQLAKMYGPSIIGGIYARLNTADGRLIWEKMTSILPYPTVRGSWLGDCDGMRIDRQYVAIPEDAQNVTLKVAWKASANVTFSIDKDRLEERFGSIFRVTGYGGEVSLEVTPGTYWLIFYARSTDFMDGGFIEFDVTYPSARGIRTWYDGRYAAYDITGA